MPLFIAGMFRDRGQADRVVSALRDGGVPSSEISLVVRETAEEDVTQREGFGEELGAFRGLAVHSGWERLGWQGGARPAYRDQVSPDIEFALVAAGPIGIAIGGTQIGATAGGVVGSMGNFGFTLDLAREWYERIVAGEAWVMVRTTELGAAPVRRVFEKYVPQLHGESLRHW